jgi:hypothetical protein
VQTSIDQLAGDANGIFARQSRLSAPLLGSGRRVVEDSYAGAYASGPGAAGGVFGRLNAGKLSLLGGLAYAEEEGGRAELRESLTVAAALRYIHDGGGAIRPFAELGAWKARDTSLRLSRGYTNGAGTAEGVGDTRGDISYYYVRAGVAIAGRSSELALSGEIGRSRLDLEGYLETLSATNPFEATVAARSERMTVYRLRGQYSHSFAPGLDGTLWASAVWGRHGSGSGIAAAVPGVGILAAFPEDPAWAEFGARVGYDITRQFRVEAFADFSTGEDEVGRGGHGGLALITRF